MVKILTYNVYLTLIILLFNTPLYGQINFVPGYIILPSQDTLKGSINDQNWDRNPSQVSFTNVSGGQVQKFKTKDLIGFGISGGDNYQKAILQVDKTPEQHELLVPNSKSFVVSDTVFLLEQVKGLLSLYHLLDENGKNHFFIKKGNQPYEELIQRQFVIYKNEQRMVGIADQYKDQLKYIYLMECPNLQDQIARTPYTKAGLQSLVQKFNLCINPEFKSEIKQVNKHKSKFGLVAGFNLTKYNFKSKYYTYLDDTKFTWQSSPVLGLSYELLLPRNRQKWSIVNELSWKRNLSQGVFNLKEQSYSAQGTISIKANYVGLTSMFRYSWIQPKFQPFVNAGIAGNFGLEITTKVNSQESINAKTEKNEKYILEDASKFEGAIVAGVGLKSKKISGEVRLENGNGYLNQYVGIAARKIMLAVLFTFYFN